MPAPRLSSRPAAGWVVGSTSHIARVHTAPSTSSKVTATLRGGAAVKGRIDPATSGGSWVRTPLGYVNIANLAGTSNTYSINGRMPTSGLCPIPTVMNSPWPGEPGYTPSTRRYIACGALPSLIAMDTAFVKRFGRHLQIDLAYRSYAEQQYFYRKYGSPRAARPGTSNHGWGVTIDFWESRTSPYRFGRSADAWLTTYGKSYGWDRPSYMDAGGSNPEYWHYEFIG